jgi:hypothetical protein
MVVSVELAHLHFVEEAMDQSDRYGPDGAAVPPFIDGQPASSAPRESNLEEDAGVLRQARDELAACLHWRRLGG